MFQKNGKIIAASFVVGIATMFLTSPFELSARENKNSSKLEDYLKFTRVLELIEQNYVDDVNSSVLVNKALKGLLSNLDAHSAFMDEKAFKDLNIQTKGEFGGLGIVVGMRNGALTVIAPIDDTPAARAGIKAGDIILKIDDKSTLGMTIDEAVNLMRGKPKTKITLTLVRKGESKPIVTTIVRDIIKIKSVKHKYVYLNKENKKDKALYIQISSFDAKVVDSVKKILKENPDAKGIILDLRNDPGGLLNQATGLLDLFIEKGVLVSQKGRNERENLVYEAHQDGTYKDIPITVLVNGGSASASEIVSGALQDHRRAVVVGEKTFGKGSVQIVVPIGNEEAVKLTVARYYLPSGRTIQNKGVEPDIIVYPGEVPKENKSDLEIKEAELKQHLKAELEKIEKDKKDTKDKSKTEENNSTKKEDKKATDSKDNKKLDKNIIKDEELYKDAQLKSAYDILKALILQNEHKGK
jgi:carboxyl-terminal processing protease